MHIPTGMIAVGSAARAYKGFVLRLRRDKNTRIVEIFRPAYCDMAVSTAASVAEAKRYIDDYIDLEQTIDELAYRKRIAPIDSAEWTLANNALIVLRYSCEEAGGLIEDLDRDWGTTFRRPALVLPSTEPRQVLPS
jgi:hypothetical protein